MRFNGLISFVFLVITNSCLGQVVQESKKAVNQSKIFVIADTVKSLSKNIMVIFQDKENNFWFGSWEDGLYKYDGKVLVHFKSKNGFPSDRVEEIKEDDEGQVFFNTKNGIVKFKDSTFTKLNETTGNLNAWGLTDHDLWFKSFTDAQFVYRYHDEILHKLELPKCPKGEEWIRKNPNSPNPYSIYCTYKDSEGNVWFGTAVSGVFRYNGSAFDWIVEPDVLEMHNGPSNGVRGIVEDKDGFFWFNTSYKYNIYNLDHVANQEFKANYFYDRVESVGSLDRKIDGPLNEYLSIIKDDMNCLWLAFFQNGVWKLQGEKTTHYPISEDGKSVPIFCLYKDRRGGIWLGTPHNGVYFFNGNSFDKFKF